MRNTPRWATVVFKTFKIATTAAGIDTVGIHDAGHWPFLDHPRLFVEELIAFLEDLPTSTAA